MKLKHKFLYLLFLLGGVGGFGYWVFKSFRVLLETVNIYVSLPVILCGFFVCLYINIVLHEVGHLIFGLIGGMKFKCIRVPLLCVERENGKLRARFSKTKSFLGMCEMYPSGKNDPAKAFALMSLGGPVGSLLTLLINVLFLCLAPYINGYLVILFGVFAPLSYLIFFENTFPSTINGARTDGGHMFDIFRKTPSSKVLVAVLTAQSLYSAGCAPRDLPSGLLYEVPQIPDTDPNYLFLLNNRYLYALDTGNVNALVDTDMRLRLLMPTIPDIYARQILPDLFFNSLFFVPNESYVTDHLQAVFKQLETENNVSACRIRGYYYFYRGDCINALKQIEEGRNLAALFSLKGLADMELRLLDRLENQIANYNLKQN